MRYYDLTISSPTTNAVIRRFTSHPNGVQQPPDPGALNIEFDVLVSDYGVPLGSNASVITIEGVALNDIYQAQQFAGMNLVLKGGMGKGLPLANPAQAGVLVFGTIFQAFGNWVGTDMTLDLVVVPSAFTLERPGNFSVNWPAGLPLGVAIGQTLAIAHPEIKQNISVSPNLVLPNTEYGICSTLRQFSTLVKGLTAGYLSPIYPGVSISIQGGQFFIYDGTQNTRTVPLQFTDFVGQPTWIDVNLMQVKAVMRADIQLGNTVTMPPGLQNLPGIVTTSQQAQPSLNKYKSAFQGSFNVNAVRHVGNFRASDGGQWCTIFNCSTGAA
jgi:hypothetical protein